MVSFAWGSRNPVSKIGNAVALSNSSLTASGNTLKEDQEPNSGLKQKKGKLCILSVKKSKSCVLRVVYMFPDLNTRDGRSKAKRKKAKSRIFINLMKN